MSDNDLIKRGVAREILRDELDDIAAMDEASVDNIVDSIPSAPREMTAREHGETLMKICASHKGRCYKCELGGAPCAIPDERTSPIVEQWAREHPETNMMTAKYALPKIDFKEGSDK